MQKNSNEKTIFQILKPVGDGDPTSKGSFTLERLRLGFNLSVTLLLEFDTFTNLV